MYGDVVSYNVVLYRISVDAVLYVKLLIVDMKQIRHLCSAFIQTKFRIIARMEDIYPSLQNTIYIVNIGDRTNSQVNSQGRSNMYFDCSTIYMRPIVPK